MAGDYGFRCDAPPQYYDQPKTPGPILTGATGIIAGTGVAAGSLIGGAKLTELARDTTTFAARKEAQALLASVSTKASEYTVDTKELAKAKETVLKSTIGEHWDKFTTSAKAFKPGETVEKNWTKLKKFFGGSLEEMGGTIGEKFTKLFKIAEGKPALLIAASVGLGLLITAGVIYHYARKRGQSEAY